MNFEKARFNMVEQQIRPWEVLDPVVLDLLMTVRREEFVPAAYKTLAFADIEIPLGGGQSMLKPVIEGKVLQAVQVRPADSVLEVGAGSGYFAALLAARAGSVRSMEIDPALARLARENLERYGVKNVTVEEGDGMQGCEAHGPYDVIVLSGGLPQLPDALPGQLKPGGRLFAFVGEAPVMKGRLVTSLGEGRFQTRDVFESLVAVLKNAPVPDRFHF